MALLFWLSFGLIGYTYVGYALVLRLYALVRSQPVDKQPFKPTVTVVIAARNEEANLPSKLENLRGLDYPEDLLRVVIASDGSTDRTADILKAAEPFVQAVVLTQPHGKAAALNASVRQATGDILVFLDTRQIVAPDVLTQLVSCFTDPAIGAVSGELHLESADSLASPDALGVYWRIEKVVRKLESATGSVVGVTGAVYAVRRELFVEIPSGLLLDDVFVPMNVARAGKRVIFHSAAVARDRIFDQKGKEFSRKVRTLTGNYQLLQVAPWLLTPANPLLFRFVSHKLMRLVVPFLLLSLLLASAFAKGGLYRTAFAAQILLYLMALLGHLSGAARRQKLVSIAYTFVLLNVAAAMAFYNFLTGRARWA